MIENKLLTDLRERDRSIGTWINLASPMAAEVMAFVGYRWMCIDAEHSQIGITEIADMIRAVESRGATPIVRVAGIDPVTIARVLDAGAYGIVAPHVSTVEQAHVLADACRYPPRGKRSSGAGRNATLCSSYMPNFNDTVAVIAQIEDQVGVDAAHEIMAVDGIDIGFLGPVDLSLDLGVARDAPEVEQGIQRVLDACIAAGKPAGVPAANGDATRKRVEQGFKMIGLTSDMRMLQTIAAQLLEDASR